MKKLLCIAFLILLLLIFIIIYLAKNSGDYYVSKVISPTEILLENGRTFKLNNIETFDSEYTEHNKILAEKLGITEDEAFITGALARDWAKNILSGRKVKVLNDDLTYYKFGYSARLKNSSFGIQNNMPSNKRAFDKQLKTIRNGKFVIVNLADDTIYEVSKSNREKIRDFIVIRQSHMKKVKPVQKAKNEIQRKDFLSKITLENIKIIVSDHTTKLKPDRQCSSDICKEIITNINNAAETIDIAIYGYSVIPSIEEAIKSAQKRGVKVRLVHDSSAKGENTYPETYKLADLIKNSKNDRFTQESERIMHNKFYIFDNNVVITGSSNLSHTDMSGYNSNSIIVIKSKEIAKYYHDEFEQMYNGKFHNSKIHSEKKSDGNIQVFFSPQDKAITNGILPLIKNAKKYIYIPTFVITEKRVVDELIKAKNRGVDVKIILDALSASNQHSKHKELRNAGVFVKAENYAGKMHSKSMIVDDEYLIIGSMNFSKNGDTRNDENMVILKNPQAAKLYKEFFLYQWNQISDKWLKLVPKAEGLDSIGSCSDGIDNNYDDLTDADDPACSKI